MIDFWTETVEGFTRLDVLDWADEYSNLSVETSIDAAYVDCWGFIPDRRTNRKAA